MRILQLIQRPQLRGAEIFACQLSSELMNLSHDVDVVYLFDQENKLYQFDLNFISLNANQSNRFWDFKAYKKLADIIELGGYDIVQANAGDTLKYAALSKKIYHWKAKLVFRNANKMSAFISSRAHLWFNQFFLRQVNFAISVSENCRQDLIDLYPKFINKSATGTIGTYAFDDIMPIETDTQNQIWINVGSFVPEKNHQFLIEIFANYLKKYPNNELWLVGDGRLRSDLEEKSEQLKVTKSVKFFGYRADALSLIKRADVMVITSKIEGLPGVILEALACGTPVVASSVGGIPEVIKNNATGYTLESFDVADYIRTIENLLNGDQYSIIAENGKSLIKNKFLMPKIAAEFEKIYLRLLNAKNKGTSHN